MVGVASRRANCTVRAGNLLSLKQERILDNGVRSPALSVSDLSAGKKCERRFLEGNVCTLCQVDFEGLG